MAFVIDFGSLFCLTEFFHVHYLASAALAFTLGVVTNYSISVAWVFDKRAVRNSWVELFIFALLGVMGLGLNQLLMYVLTDLAGLYYLLSKIISTGVTYVWNFVSRKVILFTLPPGEHEDTRAEVDRAAARAELSPVE